MLNKFKFQLKKENNELKDGGDGKNNSKDNKKGKEKKEDKKVK